MENIDYKHINLEYLYEVADDEADFVKEIIEDYLSKVPAQFADLEDSINKGDDESTKFIAHKMKSSFQFMGVQSLIDLAHQMEKAEQNEKKAVYTKSIEQMRPVIDEVLVELQHKLTTL